MLTFSLIWSNASKRMNFYQYISRHIVYTSFLRNLYQFGDIKMERAAGQKLYDIISVFLDLKRAFETIDRKQLLEKMKGFGLENQTYKWFESSLTGRTQRTRANGIYSETISNDLGTPQGSIDIHHVHQSNAESGQRFIHQFCLRTTLWYTCTEPTRTVWYRNWMTPYPEYINWLCTS